MKTKNKLFITITTATILATSIASTNAMYGNQMGNGTGSGQHMGIHNSGSGMMMHGQSGSHDMSNCDCMGTGSGQHMGMNKSGSAMMMHTKSGSYNMGNGGCMGMGSGKTMRMQSPEDSIANIEKSDLSEQEKQDIMYQYSEEMMARDLYNYFYGLYNINTFKTISESEQQHMDSVKVIIDRYNLDTPTNYGELTSLYNTLKTEGDKGLKEALESGLKIEIQDIEDIVDTIKTTDNDDVKVILVNIGGASYNHLRGFSNALKNNSLTTTIDISLYLDDTNQKGNLKDNLLKDLEKAGITLSETVKSNLNNCNSCDNCSQMMNKHLNETKKNTYKKSIGNKYGNTLKNINQDKKTQLQSKIETKIQEVTDSTTISDTDKEKIVSLYYALKEYLDEN
ncbi:MAG: DUF2202 domain-containing protein [Candidatus Gracilibacteria bacterium]|nr:DUF2202 domain-containing protein [Candidatus Gracilibacteria bacterium]